MLVVAMDGALHLKRAWDDEGSHHSPERRNKIQTMTDSGMSRSSPSHLHQMPSPTHMLPPIITVPEQPNRQTQISSLPASGAGQTTPQRSLHAQPSPGDSSKRPRLYYEPPYQQESGRVPPPAPDPATQMPPFAHDARSHQQWSTGNTQSPGCVRSSQDGCPNCVDSESLVEKVVSGLERLEAELRQVLASTPTSRTPKEEHNESAHGPHVGEAGLNGSLVWAFGSIETSTRLVREFASNQRALPRITVANLGIPPAHEQPSAITSAPPDFARSFMEKHDRERLKDGQRRHPPPYSNEYQLRPPDSGQPPPSPHPTISSGSVYGSSQSPMSIGAPGRMLPSPSSLHNAASLASVPGSYSPGSTNSAHTTHLHDLQHQISTKSLALTTLQREQDQLLAAYSRMQVRCQTLDKKSQVSDHEINTLTEEKLRLQSQVEAFEIQVEELVKARDEAQKQTTANGAQYMRIMAMSSKLQVLGADEAKRYKAERETWERDREGLRRRVEDLEAERSMRLNSSDAVEDAKPTVDSEDVLASASLDVLRSEIVRLRQSLLTMEHMFQDMQREAETIGHVIQECADIRDRLATKTLPAQQVKGVANAVAEGGVKVQTSDGSAGERMSNESTSTTA